MPLASFKKKKFIEKDEGVKFYLVHRSQKDPLYLDEKLGDHCLVPVDEDTSEDLCNMVNGISLDKDGKRIGPGGRISKEDQINEEKKFGIYFEDGYNYLQHLKEVNDDDIAHLEKPTGFQVGCVTIKDDEDDQIVAGSSNTSVSGGPERRKLQLPSSVFASKFEEEVGYFNQAAPDHDPKVNWDPEIVKFLDDSDEELEFDNDIEDDFFVQANSSKMDKTLEEDEDEDDGSDVSSGDGFSDPEDFEESKSVREFDAKSRFSTYSMTSSVIRRNEKLKYVDEHFETIFAQYDDDQIGSLDTEDIDGYRTIKSCSALEQALATFEESNKFIAYDNNKPGCKPPILSRKLLPTLPELSEIPCKNDDDEDTLTGSDDDGTDETNADSDGNEGYEFVRFTAKNDRDDRQDCESIISTYSTLYNRPAVIKEQKAEPLIKLSAKTGLPLGVLPDKAKSKNQMDKIEHKITRILPEIPDRKRDETKEERKERKKIVKEHRAERRVEKNQHKGLQAREGQSAHTHCQ